MNTIRLLVTLLFFFSFHPAQAQQFFNIRAGGNLCRVMGNQSDIFSPVYGFHAGVGFEKIISNPFGVRMELLYNQKGFSSLREHQSAGLIKTWQNDAEMTTLQIPVILSLHMKRITFDLGPYADILLKSHQYERIISENPGHSDSYIEEYENRHPFKNPEIGMALGTRIKLLHGFGISLHYLQGFSPLGIDYNWRRMTQLQVSLSKTFGKAFTPASLSGNTTEDFMAYSPHRIVSMLNINRVTFQRSGDGNQVIFRFRSSDAGSLNISDISLECSQGYIVTSGNEIRISEALFPLTCRLRYKATNPLSQVSTESFLEFEIIESGLWYVNIVNN